MKRKLLITGASGVIGSSLYRGLQQEYDVLATDIEADADQGIESLDITNAQQIKEKTIGIDTILHIAWQKDEDDFLGVALPVNVTGAYHLFEAAKENGVQRIIFASSNHSTGFYKVGEDIDVNDPYRPDSIYGLSKCYIELLGRLYSDQHQLSSFNIRIGNFPGDDRPHSERATHIWISERDLVQLVKCCIEAPADRKYMNLYGTSANTDNYYNIDYLAEEIGYRPQDNAAEVLAAENTQKEQLPQDETAFQGGQHE